MTKAYKMARRKAAASRAIRRNLRQKYIDEHIDRPGKYEGITYKPPVLIIRRVGDQ